MFVGWLESTNWTGNISFDQQGKALLVGGQERFWPLDEVGNAAVGWLLGHVLEAW
ncbi:hypothetical protein [Nannocystis punicea]|uniref:Uncharacterized protein n=1 Tax=Nannocystis punicea TaxID=2995304 RepID=A0ABY7H4A9_9BACT|nr:hypothetical protein [Nannocystis poenicansa]WAS94027.1 hypothetical protein O0S08_48485 [Nannocystis poenicansa]